MVIKKNNGIQLFGAKSLLQQKFLSIGRLKGDQGELFLWRKSQKSAHNSVA